MSFAATYTFKRNSGDNNKVATAISVIHCSLISVEQNVPMELVKIPVEAVNEAGTNN